MLFIHALRAALTVQLEKMWSDKHPAIRQLICQLVDTNHNAETDYYSVLVVTYHPY